jgi:RimJ/RimL family protein N-acetyltransferase
MYETLACSTHATEKKMSDHFTNRPEDIVGRMVRLEALEVDRHLQAIYDITCGEAHLENKSFNPSEVWGFLDCGPFANPKELQNSWVFQRKHNEASFAIVESLTDRLIGVIILTNDDPKNLTLSLELPIVKPSSDGTAEQIEACFLVMDKLFALGYRRIQLALDAHDASGKKMPGRLGFTQEGMIPKHMIVKESNRDSNIYGMLNSDWDAGARSFLYKKLHGAAAQKSDDSNNKSEDEVDEQQRQLKEKRDKEKAEEKAKE